MTSILLHPENSAQGMNAPPNPFVQKLISHLKGDDLVGRELRSLRAADQGCGKLRHLQILGRHFGEVVAVDTKLQIECLQDIAGKRTTPVDYVARLNQRRKRFQIVEADLFSRLRLRLDIIFCLCVFDVVPPATRNGIIAAAASNLRPGGLYCVIVPRNDHSITSRCTKKNRYQDGHAFRRNGFFTFYANFSKGSRPLGSLLANLRKAGFYQAADLSVHRQVCLILRKS